MRWPIKSRLGCLALAALFVITWMAVELPDSDFALRYAHRHPEWAWNHGSARMQASAANEFQKRTKPGTPIEDVVRLLAPGAAGGPKDYEGFRPERGGGTVSFNVRASYNTGLDIHYQDGKVVSISLYD